MSRAQCQYCQGVGRFGPGNDRVCPVCHGEGEDREPQTLWPNRETVLFFVFGLLIAAAIIYQV